jgi:hypothetical protein
MRRLLVLSMLAVLTLPAAAGAGGASVRTVDLATGYVDGHRVLGRTIAGVTAGLGRPDFRLGPTSRYRIGWGDRINFSVEVIFRRSGGVQRAWSIAFERGPVRDPKLGDVLARSPSSLQSAVLARYGDNFKLVRGYACRADGCVGEFGPRAASSLHLTFGTHHALGTWFTVWQAS